MPSNSALEGSAKRTFRMPCPEFLDQRGAEAQNATTVSGFTSTRTAHQRMRVAVFGPTPARYLRFEILAANGSPAVTEITVGASPRWR
jgi:hypothetical protein